MFHVSKKSTLFPRKYFKYSEERQWCQYDEIRIKKTKNKGPDRGREGGQRYRAEAARSLALSGCCPQAKNIDGREPAIHFAVKNMHDQDILLIAGKGHEPYQIIGTEYQPFNDYEHAYKALSKNHRIP